MIYAAILDTSRAQGDIPLRPRLSSAVVCRVEEAKNKAIKRQRSAAYSLLSALYEAVYRDTLPEVIFSELGKPRFCYGGISFSISHRDSAVIAVINDSGEVGCDIEELRNVGRVVKLRERFLCGLDEEFSPSPKTPVTLVPFYLDESGQVLPYCMEAVCDGVSDDTFCRPIHTCVVRGCEETVTLTPDRVGENTPQQVMKISTDFSGEGVKALRPWCVAESLLKLSGGGFSDYNSLQSIQKDAEILTFKLDSEGGTHVIAVSVFK